MTGRWGFSRRVGVGSVGAGLVGVGSVGAGLVDAGSAGVGLAVPKRLLGEELLAEGAASRGRTTGTDPAQ
ncbi:hypothetical protein [Arthrobacter sp. Sr24]